MYFLIKCILFYSILDLIVSVSSAFELTCELTDRCRLHSVVNELINYNEKEKVNEVGVMCDIDDDNIEFREEPRKLGTQTCFNNSTLRLYIIFRWTSSSILDKRFNLSNALAYFSFYKHQKQVSLWDFRGFDVDILDEKVLTTQTSSKNPGLHSIVVSNSRLDFYHKSNKISSCEDITDVNITRIESIFQIFTHYGTNNSKEIALRNINYKHSICPLLFKNALINDFVLVDLADTFYKKNILAFTESNETLNSSITNLRLFKVQNLNLDMSFLHASVFNRTSKIIITTGWLNSINGDIFKHLNMLFSINLTPSIFRKINHKQGIEWIRYMNYGLNVSLRNMAENCCGGNKPKPKRIIIGLAKRVKVFLNFPDEDFCLYVDFPFNQFVILYENAEYKQTNNSLVTCTFLWLAQYYEYYYKYFSNIREKSEDNSICLPCILRILNTTDYKSKCNFEQRLNLCNKSKYKREDIWGESDFIMLNRKLQIAFKLSLYPVLIFGLVTNIIVVFVILIKENKDLFNDFKQYTYLCLNSIVCLMIFVMGLLSWMTECSYPYEVFCPEIRKLVAIQYFKIIIGVCFVTVFKFMCNFTYVAFALNRMSLIGREHGKVVTFMADIGIKKYMGVTFLISSSLSWIKYFKYEINYFYHELGFPISIEVNILKSYAYSTRFTDFYFVFNSISDLLNYFVFVFICIIIDICSVVQLRRTLNEKAVRTLSINVNNHIKTIENNDETVNKAIKMVILNSAIGILFKLPLAFIPLLDLIADFYFQNDNNYEFHPVFGLFYSLLFNSGFYSMIQQIFHHLYMLSLSIQIFIYIQFDKKFAIGYERLVDKVFLGIKNALIFQSNSQSQST